MQHRNVNSPAFKYCNYFPIIIDADIGTRPGLHGQTIISTGLADLDQLLGGGLPLGTLTLILEDGWTQHHATILKYFLAEGAACGHVSC